MSRRRWTVNRTPVMSRLGGAFSDRPLVVQLECEKASSGALMLVGTLFEKTKLLHLPHLSSPLEDNNDVTSRLRVETESLNQQQILAQLELETFRRALLAKQVQLQNAKKVQFQLLRKANQYIASKSTGTSLPVDVIMRILRFLRIYGNASQDRQSTPLYRIAEGFTDFPKWQRAILRLIPIVLIHASSLYKGAIMKMSPGLFTTLTRHPRLFELSNDESLASIDADESVVVALKDDHPDFKAHLAKAKRFKWHTVVIMGTSIQSTRDALSECGEKLWNLRALEVKMERERSQNPGLGGIFNIGNRIERDDWSSLPTLDLPPIPHDLAEPTLRRMALPLGAIAPYAPLMSRVAVATITTPGSFSDISAILRGLQDLPPSLVKLSVKYERDVSRDVQTEGVGVMARFPNLVELSLEAFDPRGMNSLLRNLDCPSLRTLRVNPSSLAGRGLFDDAKEAEMQERFAEVVHERFPGLTGLAYFCAEFSSRPFLERMMKRNDKVGGGNILPESAYLLPRLEVLQPRDPDVDDTALLVSFATLRLRERSVSDIRSIRVMRPSRLGFASQTSTGTFWHDCHVDALRLLVPDNIPPP